MVNMHLTSLNHGRPWLQGFSATKDNDMKKTIKLCLDPFAKPFRTDLKSVAVF